MLMPMGPSNQVGYLIHHLAFVLGRQSDQVLLEQLGIGMSQFKILMTLQNMPNVRQKQIADCLAQTEASISRQIKLLEEAGMLTSEVSKNSKREHVIRLTPKGERTNDNALKVLQRYHAPMFATLNEKQLDALMSPLETLHTHACISNDPTMCQPFIIKHN